MYKGANDNNLPSYIKKLDGKVRSRWVGIFNTTDANSGSAVAYKVSNGWLKNHITESQGAVVANTKEAGEIEYYSLKFDFNEELVVNTDDNGDYYIEAVLSDSSPMNDGKSYDEGFLYELADQINNNSIVGDFDHSVFQTLKNQGLGIDAIKKAMRFKTGIAKSVKAIVDKGKLFIRAIIDKRYKKRVERCKGLSIEGAFKRDVINNKYVGGTVFGFTFAENQDPINPRATIIA